MAIRQYSPTLAEFVINCRILHINVLFLFHLVRLGKVRWLMYSIFLANAYKPDIRQIFSRVAIPLKVGTTSVKFNASAVFK
jgi:hypothetical protein